MCTAAEGPATSTKWDITTRSKSALVTRADGSPTLRSSLAICYFHWSGTRCERHRPSTRPCVSTLSCAHMGPLLRSGHTHNTTQQGMNISAFTQTSEDVCLKAVKSRPNRLKGGRKEASVTWCGDVAVIRRGTHTPLAGCHIIWCVCVCVFPGLLVNLFPGLRVLLIV